MYSPSLNSRTNLAIWESIKNFFKKYFCVPFNFQVCNYVYLRFYFIINFYFKYFMSFLCFIINCKLSEVVSVPITSNDCRSTVLCFLFEYLFGKILVILRLVLWFWALALLLSLRYCRLGLSLTLWKLSKVFLYSKRCFVFRLSPAYQLEYMVRSRKLVFNK